MPLASRLMIRFSFVYLLAGFLIGALLLVNKAYPIYSDLWFLLSIHIEILIFGWIIQLTLGTAYWILPKSRKVPQDQDKIPALAIPLTLNLGILLNIGDHLFRFYEYAWLAGRSLELVAVLIFIGLHWKRVTSFRKKA